MATSIKLIPLNPLYREIAEIATSFETFRRRPVPLISRRLRKKWYMNCETKEMEISVANFGFIIVGCKITY